MGIIERAKQLRPLIEKASKSLPDEDAYYAPELFPRWEVSKAYTVEDRIQYETKLYKCVQSHTSQEDWKPDITPALWTEVPNPSQEWPEWKQPVGAQDAYAKGDKVSHNENHWISDVDANVWEPGVYGWIEA
jgi:hypothetical protein